MRPSENAQWLAIEGWCTPEEGDALYEMAYDHGRQFPDVAPMIMEIGSGMGKSAIAMALSGVYLNSIDKDIGRISQAREHARRCGVSGRIEFIHGDAQRCEFDDTLTFLYIDGWHDSENVRSDYTAWYPHVIPNGAIWFHDAYGAGWPDVQAEIDAILARGECTFEGYVGTIAKLRKRGA